MGLGRKAVSAAHHLGLKAGAVSPGTAAPCHLIPSHQAITELLPVPRRHFPEPVTDFSEPRSKAQGVGGLAAAIFTSLSNCFLCFGVAWLLVPVSEVISYPLVLRNISCSSVL